MEMFPPLTFFFIGPELSKAGTSRLLFFKFDRRVKYPASAGVMSSAICSEVDMDQGNESEATGEKNKAFLFDLSISAMA
jgi:hypothetical protein